MPCGLAQHLHSLFAEHDHGHIDDSLGLRRYLHDGFPIDATPLISRRVPASDRAVSFLGLSSDSHPNCGTSEGGATGSLAAPALRARKSPTKTSFFLGIGEPKCHDSDVLGKSDCSKCGDTKDKCNSKDCTVWEGKCRTTTIGKDLDGNPVRFNDWQYYWGPTTCFKSGDQLKFGLLGQVLSPGGSKPRINQTEAEKSQDNEDNKLPLVNMFIEGNMGNVQVKHMRPRPPTQYDQEPYSTTAKAALADCKFNLQSSLIGGMGMLAPCDKMGRITTTEDGTFCQDNQACVTAIPKDFAKDTGKFCWQWFTPECKQVECPPPPYCPPQTQNADGSWTAPVLCPKPKPCPPQPACEAPYWKDMCKANAGQPWCVSPESLKKYRGPIEISCKATGNDLRQKKGSPDGCWWLLKNTREDLQRLPGKVNRMYAPESGYFVKGEKGAISEKQAEKWIQTGTMMGAENDNSEFLKKAPTAAQA